MGRSKDQKPLAAHAPSVLVVDDKRENLVAIAAVLGDVDGVNVVLAQSGREALRQVLERPFAVILLDITMPGLDGFETAELIRQYRPSRRTPIIFMTASGDDEHLQKSYALGGVDYVLTPVVPEILRSKVRVFAELHEKTDEVRRQALALEEHAARLQRLADASLAINAARSFDAILHAIAESARRVVECHQAILTFSHAPGRVRGVASFSDRYARSGAQPPDHLAESLFLRASPQRLAICLTRDEIAADRELSAASEAWSGPPFRGLVAAPLVERDGRCMGVLQISDKVNGDFSESDLAFVIQLAQFGTIALQNCLHAEAREANRLKDEFLATLSHELRTPLHAMLGWIRMLRGSPLDADRTARGLEVIERNINVQAGLIEGLLDVSRIITGKLRVQARPMSLARVVEGVVDAMKPAGAAKGVELAADVDVEGGGQVLGDAERLHQVFSNIVQNAVKFTPKGGRIDVSLRHEAGHVEVRVADTGAGIGPEFLPYVFDRFRQADSSTTRAAGGLGLGLSVVANLVELHGGTARADSPGLGQGATFTVRLPEIPAGAAARFADPAPALPPVVMPGGVEPPPSGVYTLDGLHVLVVDDNQDGRELLSEVLRKHRAQVTAASSMSEALAALVAHKPHVLVSDIAMEGEDGYELIRRVRGRAPDEGGAVPALALTAYARREDRARALDAGFQMHAAKPIEPHELVAAIATLARVGIRPGADS